jgi:uncharacterized membrane protein
MNIKHKVKQFVRLGKKVSVYDLVLAIIPTIMILGVISSKANILYNLPEFMVFSALNIPVIVYAIFLKPPVEN